MFNLSQVISGEVTLNEEQIASFMMIFGKYCQDRRWRRLKSVITYPTGADNWSRYDRVEWNGDHCKYTASCDYTFEVRKIRELLTK